MSRFCFGAIAVLAFTSLAGCERDAPLDHYWKAESCVATVQTPGGAMKTTHATAYLRRSGGASALLVQLDDLGLQISDPYPSGPVIRFALPLDLAASATLNVVPDASDVRGPLVVGSQTAWLMTTPRADTKKPLDDWRLGSGTLVVTAFALTERDTPDRDFVSLEGTFDLSAVQSRGGDAAAVAETVGGVAHVRCVDDLAAEDASAGHADASGDDAALGPSDTAGADVGETLGTACGQGGSCANPACRDCNGNPADFCEADLSSSANCGACGRSCGSAGACDPLGACVGVSLSTEGPAAVSASSTGVAWILRSQSGMPNSGAVRFLPFGGGAQPISVATQLEFGAPDRVLVDGNDVFFTSYGGLSRTSITGGGLTVLRGAGSVADSLRLAGFSAKTLFAWWTQAASEWVLRYDRTSNAEAIVGCAPLGVYDACADVTNDAVLVSNGTQIVRYAQNLPGETCKSTSPGAVVVGAGPQEGIPRVIATNTRIFWMVAGAAGITVKSTDLSGGAAATTHGVAASFASAIGTNYPLAAEGDTVYFIARDPVAKSPNRYRLVASTGTSPAASMDLAIVGDGVVGLALAPGRVVWGEDSGIKATLR